MNKRLAIAAALILIVFTGGYLVYGAIFGGEQQASVSIDAGTSTTPAADATVAAPPDKAPAKVVVTSVTGAVERKREDGTWAPVAEGEELSLEDEVRTGPGGAVVLELGDTATVDVSERTGVAISELSETLSRVRLQEGRISTKVHGRDDVRLRVEVSGTDAVAETTDGEFSVLSSGTGQVTVASNEGDVAFSANGETVEVKSGQQSVARPNLPPSPPQEIPASFYLKVNSSARGPQRQKTTTVRGRTTPGAVVSINGVREAVDDKGRFSTSVTLVEGRNQITVAVEDVTGRSTEKSVGVVVDSRPPDVKTGVEWE